MDLLHGDLPTWGLGWLLPYSLLHTATTGLHSHVWGLPATIREKVINLSHI